MIKVRVLVVDDSVLARALIRAMIEMNKGLTVCGEAENGRQAVAQALALQPDIITMDLQMPEMDGLQAIEEIMAVRPTPILVLSDAADAQNAMAAVARGALEATNKSATHDNPGFTERLKMLAGIPVIRHIRSKHPLIAPRFAMPAPPPLPADREAGMRGGRIFAIAASTGGPQALAQLLSGLPADFPAPVLIAQHISDGFAAGMAAWLNSLCPLTVAIAQEGERLVAGRIYLADCRMHLTITPNQQIHLQPRAERDIYRPSCDVMLTAVAEVFGPRAVGIILTGMGHDGAQGMAAIRRAGGFTLGQDEATSVVYGMNREAVMAGDVQSVLPLNAIANEMAWLARTPALEPIRWTPR
ncbi:MAG: chemotaxis-specific protein-glutamate methyltransferase CheB [Candidatus Competibacteraceae bacterium]|nr:chemotaxis-specific protein-glutamate methyltransferase CheB [Candidatus Competibacteraceae bacterium]